MRPSAHPSRYAFRALTLSETEIDDIISFIGKTYGEGDYDDSIMEQIEKEALRCGQPPGKKGGGAQISGDIGDDGADPMPKSAIRARRRERKDIYIAHSAPTLARVRTRRKAD